jgi:putative inorganic carbon (hco3(-)) transporter
MFNKKKNDNNKENNSQWFSCFLLFVLIICLAIATSDFIYIRLALPFILTAIFLFLPEEFGLYSLAFFLPAINWNFYYHGLSVSLIDLLALSIFTAFVLKKIYARLFNRKKFHLRLPLLIPFGFFFLSAFISCFFADYIKDSIWYFVRWILFFYLVYVVFPVNAAREEKVLRRTVISFVFSGAIVAVAGLISIFTQDWTYQFVRVLPLSFGNIAPIGDNHNLLAEVLIVSIPFTLALKNWTALKKMQRWYDVLILFQAIIVLGTFSRAAWIALAVEIFILFFMSSRKKNPAVWVSILAVLIILSPLFYYMYKLQSDFSIGGSSTENRLIMTEIAWDNFLNKPVFGNGTGTFINFVADNIRFVAKYGAPLDSHGVLQKILLENGFLGIFAFLMVLWSYFTVVYKAAVKHANKNPWLLPIIIGGIGITVMEFFNTSYYKGKMWLPIALSLAAVNIVRAKSRTKKYAKN